MVKELFIGGCVHKEFREVLGTPSKIIVIENGSRDTYYRLATKKRVIYGEMFLIQKAKKRLNNGS